MSTGSGRTPGYLMESPAEVARLEGKTDPAETERQLDLVGLGAERLVLDAGAGSGAVARTIARRVRPGRVVALDGAAGRLRAGRALREQAGELDGLSFLAGGLTRIPCVDGCFDAVWSRFVFEYLPDPDAVLAELVRVTRPGGKVVVGDLDGNALFHHPLPPELASDLARLEQALEGSFDPHAGLKLYHRFRRAGLEDIRVHVFPYHLYAGAAPAAAMENWAAKFETLAGPGARALGGAQAYDRFRRRFLRMLEDEDTLTYSVEMLVEGIRPPAAGGAGR